MKDLEALTRVYRRLQWAIGLYYNDKMLAGESEYYCHKNAQLKNLIENACLFIEGVR